MQVVEKMISLCSYSKMVGQWSSDINALDNQRNTSLHVIGRYEKPISDFMTLQAVIMVLIEDGHGEYLRTHT
ncbi:protein fem-1 homolog B-like isoform X2 [Belonocnema kinseyi]|uniref:protein fem-1 homolog B-like isoform X2 n=1 Tax=Belonocnema kinseyi TaxID=2817044 RepID=UPI00143D06BD|nr:protein fem-1 homolog B-like isoform X2 [Belonocnema kinseyi]